MEGLSNSVGSIPTISQDYINGVPAGRLKPHGLSRDEKRNLRIKKFLKYYNEEHPEAPLDEASEGIVVIQQGFYPYDMELVFNPKTDGRENQQVIQMGKVQKPFSIVMFSGTYWLKEGRLRKLLDADRVLKDREAERCAKKLLNKLIYKGVYNISFTQTLVRPCRVYTEGEEILLMNLCNGLIFKVKKDEFAMQKLDEERFSLGTMYFRRVFDGEGMTFQRY